MPFINTKACNLFRFNSIKLALLIAIAMVSIFRFIALAGELDANLDDLTKQITQKMGEKSKKKVAVVEFSDLRGNITDFGRYLSEGLITRLVNSGKFEDVVERKLLAKIINEHKLSLTDIVDPASAKQLGKILGVDAIVSGTVTDLGSKLEVNARLIGTEKGSIFAAASVSITKDESVSRLLKNDGGQEVATTTPEGTIPTSRSQKKVVAKIEMDEFAFEARECKRSGQKVFCIIAVTNKAQNEKEFFIFTHETFLYDNIGNQYKPSELRFGAETRSYPNNVLQILPPLLPVIAVLTFSDISPQAEIVSLPLSCYINKTGPKLKPVFRDIPLK